MTFIFSLFIPSFRSTFSTRNLIRASTRQFRKMSSSSSPKNGASSTTTGGSKYTVPHATLSEFQSSSWTSSLLASPDYEPVETAARVSKHPTGEDAYFADTLGTTATIPHLLTLRQKHPISRPKTPPPTAQPPARTPTPKSPPELITLVRLGNPGLSGHPHTAHGGAVMTLLDEVMSHAVSVQVPGYDLNTPDERGRIFTSQLDVRFLRPVYVPATCVVKAWCVAKDGRKFWMRGQLIQEDGVGGEEGEGMGGSIEAIKRKRVCADAEGFWIQARKEKL